VNAPFALSVEVFDRRARAAFAQAYPEVAHRLDHRLRDHPLLSIEALATLGEALPAASVEYNRGDLPLGVDGKPAGNGLGIGETIRAIATCDSWAVLKNVEQDDRYAALLEDLLSGLRPPIEAATGPMLESQAFVFISSPHAVTPYHFDPEHNVLLQVRGTKTVTTFPAGDSAFAPDEVHESYHTGGARELPWDDRMGKGGSRWPLSPGEALYIPVMAPHHVRNGPDVSISLSITWRSRWSFAEADARAFNGLLRRFGLSPRAPGRYPAGNRGKAVAWRAWSRFAGKR
jgi:hypothetical protein